MKRNIAFVLTAASMFGLTACGTANESDHTGNSPAQTESSQVAESRIHRTTEKAVQKALTTQRMRNQERF